MNSLEQQSKTSAEIVQEVKFFVEDFKNDLNNKFQKSFDTLAKETSSTESRLAILENSLKTNEELLKKDLEIFSSKFDSASEKLSMRTQINENNLNSLDKNIHETNGRINNLRIELEKIVSRIEALEKFSKDIALVKENRTNNLVYPLIIGIITMLVSVLVNVWMSKVFF